MTCGREELDLRDQRATYDWLERSRPDEVIVAAAKVGGIHANSSYPAAFLHDNLLIAAIKDLSLRVLLEKKFSGSNQVVTLSDEYISFPLNLLPEIQKVVMKSGLAVKYVNADE